MASGRNANVRPEGRGGRPSARRSGAGRFAIAAGINLWATIPPVWFTIAQTLHETISIVLGYFRSWLKQLARGADFCLRRQKRSRLGQTNCFSHWGRGVPL